MTTEYRQISFYEANRKVEPVNCGLAGELTREQFFNGMKRSKWRSSQGVRLQIRTSIIICAYRTAHCADERRRINPDFLFGTMSIVP